MTKRTTALRVRLAGRGVKLLCVCGFTMVQPLRAATSLARLWRQAR
jgi:hypothetical protein